MSIQFFCTDKGQHRRVEIGNTKTTWVVFNERENASRARRRDHGRTVVEHARSFVWTTVGAPGINNRVGLLCPKCGRNPQRRQAEWEAAIVALKAIGTTEVDISALHF